MTGLDELQALSDVIGGKDGLPGGVALYEKGPVRDLVNVGGESVLPAQTGPEADSGNTGAHQCKQEPNTHFRASHAVKMKLAAMQTMPRYTPNPTSWKMPISALPIANFSIASAARFRTAFFMMSSPRR